MEATTSQVFTSLKQGDQEVCEEFVSKEYEGLYRWFLWLTRDQDQAVDLTQDTFAEFWQSLQRKIPEAAPKVWLFAIGRNRWRKACRNRKRRREDAETYVDSIVGDHPEPYRSAEVKEAANAAQEAVASLPEEFRDIVVLRLWHDLDYEQIAKIQGISKELARWRFFKAKKLLYSQLKDWQTQEDHHGS